MALGDRYRFIIAACIFASTLSIYVGRINLSTTIVVMAKPIDHSLNTSIIPVDTCHPEKISRLPLINQTKADGQPTAPQFDWNETTQGLILGSFFWGYFLLQVPGGQMAEKFGPRILATIGIVGTGIVNLLTPVLAPHYALFLISRIILGGIQAMVFPSVFALTTKWIPEQERSTVIAISMSGNALGTIITSSMSGYLSKHGFAGGWPSAFYVSGIICITIGIFYFFLVRNDPKDHPLVSQVEYDYIVENISALKAKRDQSEAVKAAQPKTPLSFPWIKVLTCLPVLSQLAIKITLTWAYNLVILKAPAYMDKVLNISVELNGVFTSAAFVSFGLSHVLGGMAADFIIRRRFFTSRTPVRKIFAGISAFGTALFLVLIPLVGCSPALFLLMLIASQATWGMEAGGELPLPTDNSHEYAATLFGISNMFGMATGVFGPYITGMVLDIDPSRPFRQWSYIMYFTAAVNVVGGMIFVLFASAEKDPWIRVAEGEVEKMKLAESKTSVESGGDGVENDGFKVVEELKKK